MATKIRLKRIGRRNRPFYRLVVMDSRKRRDGAAIEELGWYNPIDADHSYDIKDDRIIHWLAEGAIPTNAAHKLLRRSGIAHQWHLMQQGLDEAAVEKEMKKWALNREEVLQARTERVKAKTAEKAKPEEVEESSDGSSEVGKADAAPKEDDPQKPAEAPQEDESDDALSPGDGSEVQETVEMEQSIEEEEKGNESEKEEASANGNEDAEESGSEESEEDASGDDPGQKSRDEDDTRVETAEEGEDEEDSKDAVAENGDSEEE
ncbi:MAG: 30S ribosomal protein S16 [Candidatus Marinimicrobia bacterium]|nr:30S ribosomal protein S16 [Candidatus Neomarinimicrobiota bacterium]